VTSSELAVFVVLREDDYETRFGDGYFAYFAGAFRDPEAAEAWAAGQRATPRPDKDTLGYSYHVRPGTLRRDGRGAWQLTAELKRGERVTVDELVAALGL